MPMISNKRYNLAISFLTPHYYAIHKVQADKKIAWIHTDYSSMDMDIESEKKMWGAYDNIISISEACTKGFLLKFSGIQGKNNRDRKILLLPILFENSQIWLK